jgi:hypothetical protein
MARSIVPAAEACAISVACPRATPAIQRIPPESSSLKFAVYFGEKAHNEFMSGFNRRNPADLLTRYVREADADSLKN